VDEGQSAHWLEVSIQVENELAEAVAEVLSRYVANGVVIENDMIYQDDDDLGTQVGTARVYGYIAIDSRTHEKRQLVEEGLWHLSQIQPMPEATFNEIADQNWMTAWKDHYKPIPIGKKLLILPAWLENPFPERLAVKIDPSMAFGTGTHPSTQLSLDYIDEYLKPGQDMIDVGCGSGILSIAAKHLGARTVVAVDTDPIAVCATQENAARNDVSEGFEIGEGTLEEICAGNFSINQAPLVVANILASVNISLLERGLAWLVAPGGKLVLAGILVDQADRVIHAATEQGLMLVDRRMITDWVALVFSCPA
jgi:ribosomal protein L11 methyltransferase